MTETQGTHLVERSPLREKGHPNEVETIETAETTGGLGETTLPAGMTLPGRPKEEEI